MAGKLRLITDLYGQTLTEISRNPNEWMSFLECAAMNYKYPFNDQVLIYAQKPTAVACAEINTWNERVGRWVNKGSKGIALISYENGDSSLKHVFDVADTSSKLGKSFRLWSVTKPYEQDIIESLENKCNNRVYVNINGNPGMATAGSGDVLAGIVVGILAGGLTKELVEENMTKAMAMSVYIHSVAGDMAAVKLGQVSMIATDIIEMISKVLSI